jgi:peptide/nickel transport system substrate-binding protein
MNADFEQRTLHRFQGATRMVRLRVLVLSGLILVLAACGTAAPANDGEATVAGGTVSRAITSEPNSLDPGGPFGSGQNILLPYLFDNLILQTAENEYVPLLAESWEVSEDGKTVTFMLKEGLVFHDGTPIDAQAVVFSFERLLNPEQKSPMAASLSDVTQVSALDERTVQFYFEQPSATFFSTITLPYAGIVSPQAVNELGADFALQPVGSGPFKLADWTPGVEIVLERNPDYAWNPPIVENEAAPHINQATFKVIPDAATQLTALQAGEVDVVFVNQPDHIERLKADPNVTLHTVNLNSLVYLGFNNQQTPLDELAVRRALSHMINKPEIVTLALGGNGEPAYAPMAPTLPGFDPSLQELAPDYDLTAARALLQEAGFSEIDGGWERNGEPLKLRLLTFTRAPNQEVATVVQNQLAALGIPVEIQQFDAPTAAKAAREGEFDLVLWRYDWNDPSVLATYLSGERIGSTNRMFYDNPAVNELFNQAAIAMNPAERAQHYLAAQRLIMADAPWIALYTPVDIVAVNARIQEPAFAGMGRMLLNDVQLSN